MKKKKAHLVLSVVFVVAITTTVQSISHSTAKTETIPNHETTYNDKPDDRTPYIVSDQTLLESEPLLGEGVESKQAKAIIPYIEKAEKSLSGEDKYLAQLLIEKLPSGEKERLMNRLHQIKANQAINHSFDIEKAKEEVTLAEQDYKNNVQLRKAQEQVVALQMSEDKMSLIERLNNIYQILIKEKEEERKQQLKKIKSQLTLTKVNIKNTI